MPPEIIGAIIMGIISICTTVGSMVIPEAIEEDYRQKVNSRKASYSDVINLINTVTSRSASLSNSQRNALSSQLNQLFNRPYISSGLSEDQIGRVKTKLTQIGLRIEKLVGEGQALEKMADNQAAAYSAYSNKEKSEAKNADGSWNDNTSAGRAGHLAEDYSNQAKEKYDQANALGEKYV